MLSLLQELQTRATTALVPATVGRVYLGIAGQERQALISDYDILILDDGGEDPDTSEHPSAVECRLKHVVVELYIRALDTTTAVTNLLTKWQAVENFFYAIANRRVETAAGVILGESINNWFPVESGLTGGEDFPVWRYRSTTIDYRVAETRYGRHPY